MTRQAGRGRMGSTKHGKSGHVGHSPKFRFNRQLEANREQESQKKPRAKLEHASVSDALKEKPRR